MKITNDEVDRFAEAYVGKAVRLHIPLKSVITLRRVAEELRALALHIDVSSRQLDEKPALVMLTVRRHVERTNKRLAEIRGRGRPKGG